VVESLLAKPFYHDGGFCFSLTHTRSRIVRASAQHRSWLHILGFAVITVVVIYVILDLDYLREGLIRLQTADQLLVKARETMN
jgi:hypothetical protein